MRVLSASELLDIWEEGQAHQPIQRGMMLLTAACPETAPGVLEKLPVGERDAKLMTLREWTFGPQLSSVITCPRCGERLELNFNIADIRTAPPSSSGDREETDERDEVLRLCIDDYEVSFRLPTTLDLRASAESEDVAQSRRLLLQRCLVTIHCNGEEVSTDKLPAEVIEAVVNEMAQADPHGDVHLSLCCPGCRHEWLAAFDIASYFWTEIDAWAHRILHEVHTLASSYGWHEVDILSMSPWRRQYYLTLASR